MKSAKQAGYLQIKALESKVEDFSTLNPCVGTNRWKDIWLSTESATYQMLLRGHAPASEPFRKWVTEVVLPTIRKTGRVALRSRDIQDFGSRLAEQVPAAQVVANGLQGVNSALGLIADNRGSNAQGYRTALWNALRHFVPNDPVSQNLMLRLAETHGVDRTR
jgi:hypothetical protein